MNTLRLFLITLVCITLTVGCSRSKTVSTPGGKVTVEEGGKSGESAVTITGNNGEKLTFNSAGAKLPDDYPKDVPVASGAKVVMSASVNNSNQNGSNLVLESSDNMDNLVSFYKKGLTDNGWKINATVTQDKMTMLAASKDTRAISVHIQQEEGKSTITQTVGTK
ncbi:MAG TPA: hypothetical protein VLT90_06355 [Terriglobales bacterium]|nr:hypothetical protein [Terriglobales bacterium]